MNNSDSQTAYGVFKPVGHVLASFPNERDARSALLTNATTGERIPNESALAIRLGKPTRKQPIGRRKPALPRDMVNERCGRQARLCPAHPPIATGGEHNPNESAT